MKCLIVQNVSLKLGVKTVSQGSNGNGQYLRYLMLSCFQVDCTGNSYTVIPCGIPHSTLQSK
jgi:hypothetical protein